MDKVGNIVYGMAGAGRASELHLNALTKYCRTPVRLKRIIARRWEQLLPMKERYGFEEASLYFDDLISDPEIDLIDICTPPYCHEEMIIKGVPSGKDVICEKPFTGYFGLPGDIDPIGLHVSKSAMYDHVADSLTRLEEIVKSSGKTLMYAENFLYAPAIVKAAEIIRAKRTRILFMKGEESLKGSSSPVAGEWARTGGGTFMRTGAHPLSAILWLKEIEAKARGTKVRVSSVLADMGRVTPTLSDYDHRHIAARPIDVEDLSTVILTFSDDTKAVVIASDTLLGGSRNYVELYGSDSVIYAHLTLNDMMETYFLDEDGLKDVYISEMLPSNKGWNRPFLLDEVVRGYADEMQDFMTCVATGKRPRSGLDMASLTARIMYAAYKSAELGQRVTL